MSVELELIRGGASRNQAQKMGKLTLVIGNKNYSSWSMRPWVLMRERGLDFAEIQIPLHRPDSLDRKRTYSPGGTVPVLIDSGLHIWQSIAIVEHLSERFPEAQVWPTERDARAIARSVSAEMHAGFHSLRAQMPLNCRARYRSKRWAAAVQEDIDRIREIWRDCRAHYGMGGDFLFGSFSAADAMFAPVVSRFQTYGVQLKGVEARYAQAILGLTAVKKWMEAARDEPWTIAEFEQV
jgi:glutathione S-transferase